MPIDPAVAIGAELDEVKFGWTPSDVLLYHLALGAGADSTDRRELRYAYERDLRVLPTFATVAANLRVFEPPSVSFPGVEVDLAKVVHGRQSVTVHGPIPVEGEAVAKSRITDVLDKGKAAVLIQRTDVIDNSGDPLWTTESSIFAKGEGGFGGHRGQRCFRPGRAARSRTRRTRRAAVHRGRCGRVRADQGRRGAAAHATAAARSRVPCRAAAE